MPNIDQDQKVEESLAQPLFTLSEAAAQRLLTIRQEKALEEAYALRVFVSGMGCKGPQYGMTFDAEIGEADTEFSAYGLRVLIDPVSANYLQGATLDHLLTPQGSAFKIDNPNFAGCGCGDGTEKQDACGCEGGCG